MVQKHGEAFRQHHRLGPGKIVLESRALLRWLTVHLGCFFCASLLLDVGALAAEVTAPATSESKLAESLRASTDATCVSADVRWTGLCNDRRALEAALRDRGSSLQQPGTASPRRRHDWFTLDVDVRASSRGSGYAARVSIASDDGAHEVREVNTDKCEELHSAVAWVLVVLARRPRVSAENQRESDATTKSANSLAGSESGGDTAGGAFPATPVASTKTPPVIAAPVQSSPGNWSRVECHDEVR